MLLPYKSGSWFEIGVSCSAPIRKRFQWVTVGDAPRARMQKGVSQDDALCCLAYLGSSSTSLLHSLENSGCNKKDPLKLLYHDS